VGHEGGDGVIFVVGAVLAALCVQEIGASWRQRADRNPYETMSAVCEAVGLLLVLAGMAAIAIGASTAGTVAFVAAALCAAAGPVYRRAVGRRERRRAVSLGLPVAAARRSPWLVLVARACAVGAVAFVTHAAFGSSTGIWPDYLSVRLSAALAALSAGLYFLQRRVGR
jgi:hypothetical protein